MQMYSSGLAFPDVLVAKRLVQVTSFSLFAHDQLAQMDDPDYSPLVATPPMGQGSINRPTIFSANQPNHLLKSYSKKFQTYITSMNTHLYRLQLGFGVPALRLARSSFRGSAHV